MSNQSRTTQTRTNTHKHKEQTETQRHGGNKQHGNKDATTDSHTPESTNTPTRQRTNKRTAKINTTREHTEQREARTKPPTPKQQRDITLDKSRATPARTNKKQQQHTNAIRGGKEKRSASSNQRNTTGQNSKQHTGN